MPMIDVYAAEGTFRDRKTLARDLAAAVMKWEGVPPLPLFKDNTAAFVHEVPADSISNVNGSSNYVRVQVLTPIGVLNREKQLGVVRELTDIVAGAAGVTAMAGGTGGGLGELAEGGWGVGGALKQRGGAPREGPLGAG